MADLIEALVATGATLAFDAVGGGKLASQILTAMEAAANRAATGYSGYGSTVHKQVYLYGFLDPRPTELSRNFGMTWGVGGWLLSPFLAKIGLERAQATALTGRLQPQDHLCQPLRWRDLHVRGLDPRVIAAYRGVATGTKYVINPSKSR
jgi:NADPH:quinone reductase